MLPVAAAVICQGCYCVLMSARGGERKTRGPRGLRVSESLEQNIQREADARGSSWSAMTVELLEEGVRMRRTPGVAFVDGATGRRAVIAGSGVEVWEAVAAWQEVGQDFTALAQNYPWLSEMQLRSALAYYQLYPDEIDARLEREASWTPERVRGELPYAARQSSEG